MEKIDIVLWVVSGGFGLMLVMWHFMNGRIDKLEHKNDDTKKEISNKFAELERKNDDTKKEISNKFAELDSKITELERKNDDKIAAVIKELQQVNTKIAVIESRIGDISINLSHLMWNQALPPRESQGQ